MNIGFGLLGLAITVLLLLVGHWFPMRPKGILAYVYGTASILIGFTIWRGTADDWVPVVGLWILAFVGGGSVVGAYKLDELILAARKGHKAEAIDGELARRPVAND